MAAENNHHNQTGLIIFLISMVGSMLFFVYIAFIHPGVEGIDKIVDPATLAKKAEMATVEEVDPETVEKPWVSSPELILAGAKAYATNCAMCHGATGLADGPAKTPETRNLVTGDWKAGGKSSELFATLQNGLAGTGMVSFKSQISKNNRWAIVHFVRSITKNKPEDDMSKLEAFAKTAD